MEIGVEILLFIYFIVFFVEEWIDVEFFLLKSCNLFYILKVSQNLYLKKQFNTQQPKYSKFDTNFIIGQSVQITGSRH